MMITQLRPSKILELVVQGLTITILIVITIAPSYAQNKKAVKWLEFKYGIHVPLGDMKDRFGTSSTLGAAFEISQNESKVFFGLDGAFLFGSVVKEDVLKGLRSFDGSIIGTDGGPGDVTLKERGYYAGINGGKIFTVGKNKTTHTGIRTQLGFGLLQHKIRVQDNLNSILALSKDKLPGYDRLTNGPAIHFALGFQYQHPKNNFHFSIMSDVYAAQTKSRRDFDNPTGGYLSASRMDFLAGLTIAYIVTISRSEEVGQIYY